MFRQIRQQIDNEENYINVKYNIIDNVNNISKKDLSILFKLY